RLSKRTPCLSKRCWSGERRNRLKIRERRFSDRCWRVQRNRRNSCCEHLPETGRRERISIMPFPSALGRAILLGAVTGMRSLMGAALFSSQVAHRKRDALQGAPLAPLANENVAKVLGVLSAGEVVADKLPSIPARTEPGPLIGRALLGALAGAAVCAEERKS